MVRFDPYSYEHHEDPYPTYRRLRDEAPAYLDPDRGFWALSRHDDVRAAIDDWPTFSSTGGITLERRTRDVEPMLIEMDPPRHTELRALVSRAFTPRRVADLEDPIRELARDLAGTFVPGESVDVIEAFAGKLPMAVISVMLGVPPEVQEQLREWSDAMLHREEGSSDLTPAGLDGATRLYGYFGDVIADRRRHPSDDLVSALVAAEEDAAGGRQSDSDRAFALQGTGTGRSLSPGEVLGFCFLLLIAGNETTTKLLGNAIFWLDAFPDQRARLLADPSLIPAAVEETLRYDTSTQALARELTRDVEIHGVTLPAGRKGLLLFGSANRDERRWDDPDRFDIARNPAGHLAFGHGIHHCLGAPLARLETRVALEVLLPVLGEYRVDATDAVRVHSSNVRGFARLPVEAAP
ncbi:MAG: cytochrome P450 [Acidimicrobiia bacterium]